MNLPYYNDDQVDLAAADDGGDGGRDDNHDGHRDYASVFNYFDSWFYVLCSMPLPVTSASTRVLCFAAFDVKG